MITGKSTHNKRIEWMWRDVYMGVFAFYYKLCYFLEVEGLLDPLNKVHITALHHIKLPQINQKLTI